MFKTLFKALSQADKVNPTAAPANPIAYRQHVERMILQRRATLRRLRG